MNYKIKLTLLLGCNVTLLFIGELKNIEPYKVSGELLYRDNTMVKMQYYKECF